MEHEGELYDIHGLCRICLERLHTEASYDLFVVPGLAKKLTICSALTVEMNDGYPSCICGVCYTRLNDFHDFKSMCLESSKRFRAMVDSKVFVATSSHLSVSPEYDILETVPTIGTTFTDDLALPSSVGIEDDEPLNFDPLLNHKIDLMSETDDVLKMLEHVDKEVIEVNRMLNFDNEKPLKLEIDDFDDEDDQPLSKRLKDIKEKQPKTSRKNHKKLDYQEKIYDDSLMTDTPNIPIIKNENHVVSNEHKDINDLTDSDTDDEDFDDDDDDDDFDEKAEIDAENNTDDDSINTKTNKIRRRTERQAIIECHICHRKFKKVTRYHDHMKYHNDKLPHQCSEANCSRGFTTANGLRLHIEHSHSETIQLHSCPEEGCDKKFPRTRQLNWHLKKVHKRAKDLNPKSYPCSGCEKIFRCPMSLKKHMYKHDGKELPFPCNICGKRFVINSALKDHLMRHAGIKNYVCPYCGVGKTTRQEWNTHIAIHTHEKQFKCELCPHASHNKQNLRMHIKIVHEKIKDYACQYCGKTFGKSNACKMHEMTHTGEKRCECKVCGKRFLYPKSLTKHLKTHEKRVLRAIEVYRKRQIEIIGVGKDDNNCNSKEPPPLPELTVVQDHSKETHQKVADEILKVCAESAATIPKDPRRVERVDIMELAGTAVNPIPSVAVPSWSPQINFMMKEGPHICPDCGQGFNGLGNLKRHHRIVHEGVKDFACRFCHKRFAKAQTLKHHEMTHTGEKPHECKDCGKRFIQSVALKRHMKVHGNAPPTIPTSVYEARVYEAREEMELRERAELAVKHKEEEERAVLAEVAKEQLNELEQTQLAAKAESYEIDINIPITLAKDLAKSNNSTKSN